MKTVLVPIAPGFEEIETITVVDILRRAGAQVTLAGTEEGPLKGSRGILVLPDDSLNNIMEKDFDLLKNSSTNHFFYSYNSRMEF